MKTTLSILAPLFVSALFACNKPGEDAQRKADQAQAQEQTEITGAQVNANDKTDKAESNAEKKTAAAENDFADTRENYRHDMQKKLDDLDQQIADLDAKAKTETGRAKTDLENKVIALRQQRDAFASDFTNLQTTPAANWDAAKARVDNEWSALKKNVDKAR